MQIIIPKVIVAVNMADYAAGLAGKNLYVWVNPTMKKLQEYNDLVIALQAQELDTAKQTLVPGEVTTELKPTAQSNLLKTFEWMARWVKLKKDKKIDGVDPRLLEWYLEIWNQGAEDTHWSMGELRDLETQDPAFVPWMITQTWNAHSEHIERKKKV